MISALSQIQKPLPLLPFCEAGALQIKLSKRSGVRCIGYNSSVAEFSDDTISPKRRLGKELKG